MFDLGSYAAEASAACALVRDALPVDRWPDARALVDAALASPPPLAALPLAACRAVGGEAQAAVPGAAAWLALNLSLRVYDDAMDEDRPDALWATLGPGRAVLVAAVLRETASLLLLGAACPAIVAAELQRDLSATLRAVAIGQAADLSESPHDLGAWWRVMSQKSGQLFALVARLGARLGGAIAPAIDAVSRYGHAVGLAFQLADDWAMTAPRPDARDLAIGKRTAPIWLALALASPAQRAQLDALLAAPPPWDAAVLGQLLDDVGARPYTLWLAHRMANRAVDALAPLPAITGLPAQLHAFLVSFARAPLAALPAHAVAAPATPPSALACLL